MKMSECPVSAKNLFWQDIKEGSSRGRGYGVKEGLSKTNVFVDDKKHNDAVHKKMNQIWYINRKESK